MVWKGNRPTRRGVILAGGAFAVAGVVAAVTKFQEDAPELKATHFAPPISDPTALPDRYDPEQRYLQLVGGGDGVLYGIQSDGKLIWHRHTGWKQSSAEWASGSGRVIGAGFHRYVTVMGGEDGSLFALCGDGTIVHKRYVVSDPESGAGRWMGLETIGQGFDRFDRVFGYDGAIYGVSEGRGLWAFRYDQAEHKIGEGRQADGSVDGVHFGADTDGVIYGYYDGYVWNRRLLDNGKWSNTSPVTVARGIYDLAEFGMVIFAGQGRFYYCEPPDPARSNEGKLMLQLLTNYVNAAADNRDEWATGAPVAVGTGFTLGATANLQGYPLEQTVVAGATIKVAISTTFDEIDAAVVRLAPAEHPEVVRPAVKVAGAVQKLAPGYVHDGCRWVESLQADISSDWPSGVYAVRLTGPRGLTRHVPFVVRPQKPAQRIAVILPTNTYMAYNSWGGHSQYCSCRFLAGKQRLLSFHRPLPYEPTQQGGHFNATLFADLLLLRWMTVNRFGFDVYADDDHDRDPELTKSYRAVVLPSHPEYYSARQRDHLLAYQQAGGRTLYLGGNGIYERVSFTADRNALTFRRSNGRRDVYGLSGRPSSELLGTNWNPTNYQTYAAYEVVRDHPLLAGTGLKPGALFGDQGVNGPASGCEVDCRMGMPYEVAETDIFARGQNPRGGAEMLLRPGPNGGFLFSVGSQSFTGALFTSDALSKIVRNAFELALS